MDNPRNIAIRRILLPRDTNHRGEIFGGAILAEIDLAGAVEARRHTRHDVATRSVKEIKFDHPVRVGEVVTFWTRLVRLGTTSITVSVEVESSVDGSEAQVSVTAAEVTYVAIQRQADGSITKVEL
jgi:acyl-CoA thioesterase YciA